jgi:transcriptional regulator
MATNKRTQIERDSDLVKIGSLYFQGKTQADIAKELKITQQQISYDLKTLQTRWIEAGKEIIDAAKGRELAKIVGLDAPTKADVTSNGETLKAYVNVEMDKV